MKGGPGIPQPSKWGLPDVRKLIDAALDGFAFEFFLKPDFNSLSAVDRATILRMMKQDQARREAAERARGSK